MGTTTVTAINRGTGEIAIHRAGCKDIKRDARGASIWDIEAGSFQDIIEDVCGDFIAEDEDTTWRDFTNEVKLVNCCPKLPYANTEAGTIESFENDDAPTANTVARTWTSHAACGHDRTPKARAACRKAGGPVAPTA